MWRYQKSSPAKCTSPTRSPVCCIIGRKVSTDDPYRLSMNTKCPCDGCKKLLTDLNMRECNSQPASTARAASAVNQPRAATSIPLKKGGLATTSDHCPRSLAGTPSSPSD